MITMGKSYFGIFHIVSCISRRPRFVSQIEQIVLDYKRSIISHGSHFPKLVNKHAYKYKPCPDTRSGNNTSDFVPGSYLRGHETDFVVPWQTSIPIKDVDPRTTPSPEDLLFFKYSKTFKDDGYSFFSWLAGRFDAAGRVYFKEDIPKVKIVRKCSNPDHRVKILKSRDEIEGMPTYAPNVDSMRSATFYEYPAFFYDDYEEERATYNWPVRVAEIIFAEDEIGQAYYLKLMLRYSYVAKTYDKKWAWRCGDDRGLMRLVRMLKGQLYFSNSLSMVKRLCVELGTPELYEPAYGNEMVKYHWFTGFFEVTGRFRVDMLEQKPYVSIVWEDPQVLKIISSLFKAGRIRKFNIKDESKFDLEYDSNIFTDYSYGLLKDKVWYEHIISPDHDPLPLEAAIPDENIIDNWWCSGHDLPYNHSPMHYLSNYRKKTQVSTYWPTRITGAVNPHKRTNSLMYSPQGKNGLLYELVIDNVRGLSPLYTYLSLKPSRGPTAAHIKFWHKVFIGSNTKYDGEYVNRSGLNSLTNGAHHVNELAHDFDLNTLLNRRRLPYKSLYDCSADNELVWITQSNEKELSEVVSLDVNSRQHPTYTFLPRTIQCTESVVLPQHVYTKSWRSFITAEKFYYREMEVDMEPIGSEGLYTIMSDSIPPLN